MWLPRILCGQPVPMYEPLDLWYQTYESIAYAGTYSRRLLLMAKGCPGRGRSPVCLALLQAYILQHIKHLFRRGWSCRSRSNRAFPGQDSPVVLPSPALLFTISWIDLSKISGVYCLSSKEYHSVPCREYCPPYLLQLLCQYWCHLGGLFSA